MNGPRAGSAVIAFDGASVVVDGGVRIVDRLTLEVFAGETVVLLGRSGAGKTTALKLVNRLVPASAGEVRVSGRPVDTWDPVELRRGIGYVIQEIGLFPHLTALRNVSIVPEIIGWSASRREARSRALLEVVGLDPVRYAGRYPHELSGGQRQRVGVARALAADPPLLLLDEPFGALDPITRTALRREFREIMGSMGKAALFVTHDVAEAVELGDRVALMNEGRLVAVEPAAGLRRSQNPHVRAILGDPGVEGGTGG